MRYEQAVDSLLAMPANKGVKLTSFHQGVFISYAKVFYNYFTLGTNTMHSVEVVLKRMQMAVTIKDASNCLACTKETTGVPTMQTITTL